jgi:hypothetical protein
MQSEAGPRGPIARARAQRQPSAIDSTANSTGPASKKIGTALSTAKCFDRVRFRARHRHFGLALIDSGHCTGWRAITALVNAYGDITVAPLAWQDLRALTLAPLAFGRGSRGVNRTNKPDFSADGMRRSKLE